MAGGLAVPTSYPLGKPPIDKDPYTGIKSFVQVFNHNNITAISTDDFYAAHFEKLCPSGNCIQDCRNTSRVFQAVPDGIDLGPAEYGKQSSPDTVTLFGVCTNLAYAAEVFPKSSNSKLKSLFKVEGSHDNNISMVTSKVASCFASTCDLTRESEKCRDACSLDNFLADPTHLNFNFDNNNTGSLACISRLCDNTCSLPYANQDALGVGVLATYYIQALAVILCAAGILISKGWQMWTRPGDKPELFKTLKKPLGTFVAVQTYFGISAAIATFVMHPASVDPLNGYALLAVSIMGLLPPVFTLVLAQSHGIISWFSTGLVFISYLVNSVNFGLLYHNLSSQGRDAEQLTLKIQGMFHTTSCGGSSAMALCRQLTNIEPLAYLDEFFNKSPIPNIKTVPVLWVWTTVVLVNLVGRQTIQTVHDRVNGGNPAPSEKVAGPGKRSGFLPSITSFFALPVIEISVLALACLLFGLGLGYQFLVVRAYQKMDVIDKTDWSFGQVVAVLFWIPPILDIFHGFVREKFDAAPGGTLTQQNPLLFQGGPAKYSKLRPAADNHAPAAHSPASSPGPSHGGSPPPALRLNFDDSEASATLRPNAIPRRPLRWDWETRENV